MAARSSGALYDGETPVGFVMVSDEVDGPGYIAQYLWKLLDRRASSAARLRHRCARPRRRRTSAGGPASRSCGRAPARARAARSRSTSATASSEPARSCSTTKCCFDCGSSGRRSRCRPSPRREARGASRRPRRGRRAAAPRGRRAARARRASACRASWRAAPRRRSGAQRRRPPALLGQRVPLDRATEGVALGAAAPSARSSSRTRRRTSPTSAPAGSVFGFAIITSATSMSEACSRESVPSMRPSYARGPRHE